MGFNLNLIEAAPAKPDGPGPWGGVALVCAFLIVGSGIAFGIDAMFADGRYGNLMIADVLTIWNHALDALFGP